MAGAGFCWTRKVGVYTVVTGSYMFVSFLVPIFYGAWRFTVFHALFGPLLAARLTGNVNEVPAVWCLFSLGLVLIALSPVFRQNFEMRLSRKTPSMDENS
jgi:hypothetical protein